MLGAKGKCSWADEPCLTAPGLKVSRELSPLRVHVHGGPHTSGRASRTGLRNESGCVDANLSLGLGARYAPEAEWAGIAIDAIIII